MWYCALLLLVISSSCGQAYKAAVVHYFPSSGSTPEDTILKNVKRYRKYANKACKQGVDILVFPEYGLVTTDAIREPEDYAIKIPDNPVINQLSIIASGYGIYLVVNVFEKLEDKYYNTNLVFDRNGTIVIKYHKMHLFNEARLTPGATNQTSTFSTDFGVNFGIFTCFDIFFLNPSQNFFTRSTSTIIDIIFVTGWLPSYISLSVQQGYSMANKINLLASNYGRKIVGYSGTGIYLADGQMSVVTNSAKTKMIIQEVPSGKKLDEKTCQKMKVSKIKEKITTTEKYKLYDIDLSQRFTSIQICNDHFCCILSLEIDARKNSSDSYKFLLYDDSIFYSKIKLDLRICSLLSCTSDSIDSCGSESYATTQFQKISVQGHLKGEENSFFRPIAFGSSSSPLKRFRYCEGGNGTSSFVHVKTRKQKDLAVFGIFQRKDTELDSNVEYDEFKNSRRLIILFWGGPHYY